MQEGSLIVVGTGISVGQLTMEARGYIASADKVLYCVADAATERMILRLNSEAESLYTCYGEGKQRKLTYDEMTDRILEEVRCQKTVCAAFYGHPGLFVNPSHRAIKIAREEGYPAKMTPGVSSIDCLLCDLGVDLSIGCQIYEATDLMLRQRAIDPSGHVIIMQVAALGDLSYSFNGYDYRNLPSLADYLGRYYPPEFKVKIYEASHHSVCEPDIREISVSELTESRTKGVATLFIPQMAAAPIHLKMVKEYELGYLLDDIRLVPLNAPAGLSPLET